MKTSPNLHLILLPIVFFLSIPCLFISQNIQDISNLEFAIFFTLATFAIIAILILLVANYFCKSTSLQKPFNDFTEFVFFFIVLTGFFLPVSVSEGMIDPSEALINSKNLILALILACFFSLLSHSINKKGFYVGILIFLILNVMISGAAIFSKFQIGKTPYSQAKNMPLHNISKVKNIFVFSLDGVSSSAVNEVLSENDRLSALFGGFTLFSHVASSSPATSASTATSLYGNKDFKAHYSTEAELWNSNPENLLTNVLNRNRFQVSTFDIYGHNFANSDRSYYSAYASSLEAPKLLNYVIARTITGLFVLPEAAISGLDKKIQSLYFSVNNENRDEFQEKLEHSFAPAWKKDLAVSILDANDYILLLEANQDLPTAHFLHFTFTHFPVEFDENCVFRADDEFWFNTNQNRKGVKSETVCAIQIFSAFINKLKKLDVFDKSLVVLKSDHGKPVKYYDQGTLFAKKINEHSDWGYGRYEPFLAIKGWGQKTSELDINTSPVLIDDLAKTICNEALSLETMGHETCAIYPGYNLLANPLVVPDSARATMFIVTSDKSNYKFDTHKSVTVKRAPNIIQNLDAAIAKEND